MDKNGSDKKETMKKKTTKKRSYGKDIKNKAVQLAKEGKTVGEIVKSINGPKSKAVIRYLKAAKVDYKK